MNLMAIFFICIFSPSCSLDFLEAETDLKSMRDWFSVGLQVDSDKLSKRKSATCGILL